MGIIRFSDFATKTSLAPLPSGYIPAIVVSVPVCASVSVKPVKLKPKSSSLSSRIELFRLGSRVSSFPRGKTV